MTPLLKKLIIILIVASIGFVAYYVISGNTNVELPIGMGTSQDSSITEQSQKILSDTKRIDEYKIDTSIFEDVRFTSLTDIRVEIADVATGRSNPFAPIH